MDKLFAILDEHKISIHMEPAEKVLRRACYYQSIEVSHVLDSSQRYEWSWVDSMNADDKLAMGISLYDRNKRFKKEFENSARYFNSELSAGKSEANYLLG